MADRIRVGTRPSALALKQVEEVQAAFPDILLEPVSIRTRGDKDKASPLSGVENSDFFTREIEEALIGGRIDAAVHSAKDLEEDMPEELAVAAITRSISKLECLVSRGNLKMGELPSGAVVGSSSAKRKTAMARIRPDLVVKDIRGNIDERLAQLDEGKFDAVIVAHAALMRLGYEHRIAEIIPKDIMEPHPLQGSLAIQARRNRLDLLKIFERIG